MKWLLSMAILAAVAGASATWFVLRQTNENQRAPDGADSSAGAGSNDRAKSNGCSRSADDIAALARLEPEDGVININGTPGDRLRELKVRLGEHVHKGDELAVLESRSLREGELDLAEAQLREAHERQTAEERYAEAMLAEAELAEEQARLEELDKDAQQKKVAGLESAYRTSAADLERLEKVRRSPDGGTSDRIVSDQRLAHQRLETEKSLHEWQAAVDELVKLEQSIDLAHRQARAKRNTAEANRARIPSTVQIGSLEKQVELARRKLEQAVLKAPCDGEILKTFLTDGDTLTQQPILQMADTSRMVAVAEVYEDDVRRIRLRAEACVESSALAESLVGEVSYIGNMVAKNTVVGLDPTASTDKRVIEARIRLRTNSAARSLINLQVTARIRAAAPADKAAVALGQQPRK